MHAKSMVACLYLYPPDKDLNGKAPMLEHDPSYRFAPLELLSPG